MLGSQRLQRVRKQVVVEYLSDENIEILVKDNQNLNEFAATVAFDKAYLSKLVHWISKRRFQVVEQAREDTILLRVDIFSFELKLKASGEELAAMLSELRNVRQERESIMKEIKLFDYFFLNVFNEQEFKGSKGQGGVLSKIPAAQIDKYVEDPEALFVVKQALAVYRHSSASRAGKASDKGMTLLCFEEDMCFDNIPQRFPGPFVDKLLIDGPGFKFATCTLTRLEAIKEEPHNILIAAQ